MLYVCYSWDEEVLEDIVDIINQRTLLPLVREDFWIESSKNKGGHELWLTPPYNVNIDKLREFCFGVMWGMSHEKQKKDLTT